MTQTLIQPKLGDITLPWPQKDSGYVRWSEIIAADATMADGSVTTDMIKGIQIYWWKLTWWFIESFDAGMIQAAWENFIDNEKQAFVDMESGVTFYVTRPPGVLKLELSASWVAGKMMYNISMTLREVV